LPELDFASLAPVLPTPVTERLAARWRQTWASDFPNVDWLTLGHLLPEFVEKITRPQTFRAKIALGVDSSITTAEFLDQICLKSSGWLKNTEAQTWQVAVHESGHLLAALLLMRETPCCLGISKTHFIGHPATGRYHSSHGRDKNLCSDDLRLTLGCLRAGEAAERLILGQFAGCQGDRRSAIKRWRYFLKANQNSYYPLDENLWAASLDLANWALEANLTSLEKFAQNLIAEPLQQGEQLMKNLRASQIKEPMTPRPALWTR
jgi:hypothetical protein